MSELVLRRDRAALCRLPSATLLVVSATPCQVCGLKAGGAHGLVMVVLALSGPMGWSVWDGGGSFGCTEGRGRLTVPRGSPSGSEPPSPPCPSLPGPTPEVLWS